MIPTSPSPGFDDVAGLEAGSRQLRHIADAARTEAAVLYDRVPDLRRLAGAVAALIGGSATEIDARLFQSIEAVVAHLTRSVDALHQASRNAESLAQESNARFLLAREQMAVQHAYGQPPR